MPIPNYGVLKGDPQAGTVSGEDPHFRIPVTAGSRRFTVDVNVQSTSGSEVLYLIDQNFTPPDPNALIALATGITPLTGAPGGLALDYVRERINGAPMITRDRMSLLDPGGAAMQDQVAQVVNQAIQDQNGVIYAFMPSAVHSPTRAVSRAFMTST